MDFIERLHSLSKKIKSTSNSLITEEATKNALVMPFLHSVLGYDVFDPNEVMPEFTADVASKKGEKVDYALLNNGEVQILIECKKYQEKLTTKHAGQLFRYFSVTDARLAILTNGAQYEFYTDLDAPNKMDEKPFLTLNLEDIDEHIIPEIKKLTKDSFDVESVVNSAGELKYLNQITKLLDNQFKSPEEDFVRFFASRVYDGMLTSKVKAQFTEITQKALERYLNDSINKRLKSAISNSDSRSIPTETIEVETVEIPEENDNDSKIVTTEEEIEGYNVVKAIMRQTVDLDRVIARDTQSYFGILLDDNNRKPICRLHFNARQKYLGVFDQEKKETRHPIDSIDEIFDYSEQLQSTISMYE